MENNRYNNSKVYKLVNSVDDTFYIGSTTSTLSKRLSWHKSSAKNEISKNRKVNINLNKIGFANVKIILIASFVFDTKEQLLRAENEYIEMYKHDNNCLNSCRSFVSGGDRALYNKEYYKENKEQIIDHVNKYRKDHLEDIRKKKHHHYVINR